MNSGYEQPTGPIVFVISGPNMSSNIINIYIYIYRSIVYSKGFPYILRTSKSKFGRRNYDRPKLEASHEQWLRETSRPTVFMISGPNMSSNIIKVYMDGFYTQRGFHIV